MKPKSPVLYEVQVHPASVRSRVRTLFFRRVHARLVVLLVGVVAATLVAGLLTARPVMLAMSSRSEIVRLTTSRAQQGERLKGLLAQFERLSGEVTELSVQMEKVYLAYGLTGVSAPGTGGFPRTPRPATSSIYGENLRRANQLDAKIGEELAVLGSFLDEIRNFETQHRDQISLTPSASPLKGPDFVLTSPFGTRRNPFTKALGFHAGLDLAAPEGTPIHAPADATVAFAGRYPLKSNVSWWRYGNLVVLRHGSLFVTIFGHCNEVRVRTGQKVRQGEVIATVGNTGWSTSPHLHYEVRRIEGSSSGTPVDPRIYILDHSWRDEERLLVAARQAPDPGDYEPLPAAFARGRG